MSNSIDEPLHRPWLIAVWPGMGHVAASAAYYLMSKLGMHLMAELPVERLFDIDHVDVSDGILRTGNLPQSRFFVWHDPNQSRDLIVFFGEAQPPSGKYEFCGRVVEFAKQCGVEQIITFAAMATQMRPEHDARVFCAATDPGTLSGLTDLEVEILQDGQIRGLNGLLLGVAADQDLRGACLLGEMPHLFAQLPYPKASLAVLRVFLSLADIDLDLSELQQQAAAMDEKLEQLLTSMESGHPQMEADEESYEWQEETLNAADEARIERLFAQAKQDKAKAYELKSELDRLNVFADYEDRFLDLFKKPE